MPLIKSKSKKAFEHNIKAEMHAGKPQNQSLAIAYSIKKKAKKKMAEGGEVSISAKTEKRPSTQEVHGDSDETRRNRGDKPSHNDSWTDRSTIVQAQRPSKTPLSEPKMAESSVIRTKMRKDEHNLMHTIPPSSPKDQPSHIEDEEGADRQGPESRDLHMKRMANGGNVDPDHGANHHNKAVDDEYGDGAEEDHLEEPQGLTEDDDERTLPVDEYMSTNRMSPMLAEGGHIEESQDNYADDGDHDSIAAAIMARRDRLHDEVDSGAHDEDLAAAYTDGGEVDLAHNAEEEPNNEDQMSFEALKKENYSESEGLDALDQPTDSNEEGDEREDKTHDKNDRVSAIRSRMKSKRQF